MEAKKLDRLAWSDKELPQELGYADTLYFLMMRALYQYSKVKEMDPEQGAREKSRIVKTVRTYRMDGDLFAERCRADGMTGTVRAEYRKARNRGDMEAAIAAADKLVEMMERIPANSGAGPENGQS